MELIEVIKKTFKKLTVRSILVSVILIAVAVLLITNPEKVLTVAVIIAGIALIINAIVHIIVYMGQSPEIRAMSSEFLIGIIECVVGIIFIINQQKVISFFYIIIGIWLMIESIQKLQMAINLREFISNWALTIIVAILDLVLGILVIIHPYDAGTSVTQVTGIILAVSEGFNLMESIYTLFRVRKIEKKANEVKKEE
ncbi:MAG: DUF308 domain-containing protein [Clostridia bacterium]|nr:DUF308 domain-containing protein [Clostridia bacterium]